MTRDDERRHLKPQAEIVNFPGVRYTGPMTDAPSKTTMFRGEATHVWKRRLELRGWPSDKAEQMATFLTVKGTPPPKWEELVGK